MRKYISTDLIKDLMKNNRLLQGNCEYELWKQEVDKYVDNLPCYEVDKVYKQGWNDAIDAMQNAKFASVAEQTERGESDEEITSADRPQGEWIDIGGYEVCKNCHEVKRFPHWNFCPNCGADMRAEQTEPNLIADTVKKEWKSWTSVGREQTEPRRKTTDYCDICNHEKCGNCVADGTNPYCIPSNYEPKQTEPTTEDCSEVIEDCDTCRYGFHGSQKCDNCRVGYPSNYEPITDCPWK